MCAHTHQPLIAEDLSRSPLVLSVHGETFFSMPIVKYTQAQGPDRTVSLIYDVWHLTTKGKLEFPAKIGSGRCQRVGTRTVSFQIRFSRSDQVWSLAIFLVKRVVFMLMARKTS